MLFKNLLFYIDFKVLSFQWIHLLLMHLAKLSVRPGTIFLPRQVKRCSPGQCFSRIYFTLQEKVNPFSPKRQFFDAFRKLSIAHPYPVVKAVDQLQSLP